MYCICTCHMSMEVMGGMYGWSVCQEFDKEIRDIRYSTHPCTVHVHRETIINRYMYEWVRNLH